jgi:hypothetical protein
MKEVDCFSSLEKEHVGEQINAIMDGRGAELRLEITLLDDLITNLETLLNDSAEMALGDDDAQHLLDSIIGANVSQKYVRKGEAIIRPPPEGWSVGRMRAAIDELAEALSKSAETIIADTIERVTEEGDEKRSNLRAAWHFVERDGLPKAETAALLNLYDRRLLNTLTRLYNLLERMQGARLGKPVAPTVPLDVTITHSDGNGE